MKKLAYPPTHTVDQVDAYHGTRVADPYRWLEDTDSPETAAWVAAQNALTFDYLEKIPARQQLLARLTELWDYPRAEAPFKRSGRYFQLRNSGLQNQAVLYVLESLAAEPRLLLDPNTLSEDGTVALTGLAISQDGQYMAYATSASGSDWLTWRVRNVTSGTDLPDLVEWSKFSGAAWLPDGSGFYYARYTAPDPDKAYEAVNRNQELFLHRLGQPQSADALVYARPDQPDWGFGAEVSNDGRYLVLSIWQGTETRNRLFYQDLQAGGPVVELIADLEAAYQFIDNDGPVFFLRTDLGAPHSRLIALDTAHPAKGGPGWREIIPERGDVLENVLLVNHQFLALYLHDAHHQLNRFALDGTCLGEIALPTLGTVIFAANQNTRDDRELFYTFTSFAQPGTVYRYDFQGDASEVFFKPPLAFDFDPYLTRQVFVTSKDGARVPLFLVHRRDLQADGRNPALLYGYGGFSVSLTPAFAVGWLAWLERGGVLAVANLRGGGEYGEEWHQAGTFERKQNVFDDFIACAEYLIAAGITSSSRLAIQGRSNGGLLVGACLTQRPELFGAALPAVGVMDMLRFHKFTIGWAWVSDYGSADDPEQFKALLAYSPLHNIRPGTAYPPTLITSADHDDRVVPGHSFKFAAALQAAQAGDAPVLIRIQTKAGHGFGRPTRLLIEEQADLWAFLTDSLEFSRK